MKKLIIASLLLVGCVPNNRFVKVADKVLPACVSINVVVLVDSPFGEGVIPARIGGSGVFITETGYVLTCAHLFDFKEIKAISVEVYDGGVVAGELVSIEKDIDLALVKTSFFSKTPYVKLADPRTLKVGQEVVAIGSPLGLTFTVTTGIISALYRDFDTRYNVTQSDVSINPGNSGGPLFNLNGQLIGINSFMMTPSRFEAIFTGLGFSVQVSQCLEFLTRCAIVDPSLRRFKWLNILYNRGK